MIRCPSSLFVWEKREKENAWSQVGFSKASWAFLDTEETAFPTLSHTPFIYLSCEILAFHIPDRRGGLKRYPFRSERYLPVIGLAPLVGKIKTNHFIKLFWVSDVPASAILHEIPALWGDVTRDDSQRRFLAQHSVATLLRQCFEWLQHSVPVHYNAGLRRKSSLRIVPCNITLTREKVFLGPTTKKVCKSTRLFIVKKVGLALGCLYWLDQYPAI